MPDDLVALWRETGGGDIFETETILGPGSDRELGDDVMAVNTDFRGRGLADSFAVFHVGSFVSAIDKNTKDYVELDPATLIVRARFRSLDEWYAKTLRAEFAARYGLP
jgi:hypothetical protein